MRVATGRNRAMLVAVLLILPIFVSGSIGYAYQALRNVPVFGTSGGMEAFVEAVERATDEVRPLAEDRWRNRLAAGRVEQADNNARALERFALLQARDLMRAHLGPEGSLPAEITYLETEPPLRSLCTLALTGSADDTTWVLPTDDRGRSELIRQCQPEPTCISYRSWLGTEDARALLGAPSLPDPAGLRGRNLDGPVAPPKTPAEAAAAADRQNTAGSAQRPTVRALLGCSQRDLLVAGVQRQTANAYDALPSEIAVASLRLSYPDIEASEWASIRTFVDSFRMLMPRIAEVHERVLGWSHSDFLASTVAGLAVVWSVFWQLILWLPLFISYLLLAILTGGLAGYLGQRDELSAPRRMVTGAAAALVLVGVTLAGINLATIGMPDVEGVPNPAVVLMMSLLAGAVGNEIIQRIKAAAGALFNAPAPTPANGTLPAPAPEPASASQTTQTSGQGPSPQPAGQVVINVTADPAKVSE